MIEIELFYISNYYNIVYIIFYYIPLACGKTRSNSPRLEYFKTLELQYPSAMKISPVDAIATEVG